VPDILVLGDLLRRATVRLSAVSPSARLDAEAIMAHALGLERGELIAAQDHQLNPEALARIESLLHRRELGEPVAYLTGKQEFWSLPLAVSSAVLIPRPETELLVERTLARLPANLERTIADLGTGSGAIALAIAHERPQARLIATDTSAAALAIARHNAATLAIDNVDFRRGDWLAGLGEDNFDVIVSNPPYVSENDPHLLQGALRFEPRLALTSGTDGLDAIRTIIRGARRTLKPDGWLLIEHGHDQAPTIEQLLEQFGYAAIRGYKDLAGHPRVMEACTK